MCRLRNEFLKALLDITDCPRYRLCRSKRALRCVIGRSRYGCRDRLRSGSNATSHAFNGTCHTGKPGRDGSAGRFRLSDKLLQILLDEADRLSKRICGLRCSLLGTV
ncbi:hypothetical protein X997_4686 [Burkholderia pseudomallei A79C]|nr:hypothetical protein X997_4686 [Burkholderia pseudomallei A79C]